MANMEDDAPTTIECGFCLKQNMALRSPRQLTCSHVHCLECLTGFYEDNHMLVCPFETCRQVCEVPLGELPSFDAGKHKPRSCDVCIRNEEQTQHAVSYCNQCEDLYCAKHSKIHDDYHKEIKKAHQTIDMEQYDLVQRNQSRRVCAEHENKPISMGCKKCLKMICVGCFSSETSCSNGEFHQLLSLEELVALLNDEMAKLKKGMFEKEEALEGIFKFTSQTLAEYDEETTTLVQRIHDKRDEQIAEVRVKYYKLEQDLTEARQATKTKIADFLEDKVRAKWSQLRNLSRRIDVVNRHAHECEVVSGYRETKKYMESHIDDILPSIKIPTQMKVKDTDGSCAISLAMVSTEGFLLDSRLTLEPYKQLPKSLKLVNTLSLPSNPQSIHISGSEILVGLKNRLVYVVDSSYKALTTSLNLDNHPGAIESFKGKLYLSVYGNPRTISLYDQQNKIILSWSHEDYLGNSYTGLAITCDKLVAPDRQNKLFVIYSLEGSKIGEVPCPQLSQSYVSLCASGPNRVIVSDYGSSKVFMMDITDGQLLWTCGHVPRPEGVVCYGDRYLLVAAGGSSTIRVLDCSTGDLLSELTDSAIDNRHVFDMSVSEDRLTVANYGKKTLAVYQLMA